MDKPELEPVGGTSVKAGVPGVALAALIVLIVGVGVSGGSSPAPLPEPTSAGLSVAVAPASLVAVDAASPTTTPSRSTSASATPDDRPAWVADLAGQLECDGPPADFGQEVPVNPGPFEPAATPDKALEIARLNYSNLPSRGFDRPQIEGAWARQRYVAGGQTKALAVSTNRFAEVLWETGWEVAGLRACDPSEFDSSDLNPLAPTIWLDANGRPVRTDLISSLQGPGHCGWESTIFMRYLDRQYIRDPKHVLADYTDGPFDRDVELPFKAVDTGLHTQQWHVFSISSRRAVFVRTSIGRVERWPYARDEVGCA
jgi:hypothetical protein